MRFFISLFAILFVATAQAEVGKVGVTDNPCEYLNSSPSLSLEEIRKVDFGQLCFYEKENSALKNAEPNLIFFGDSITQWWGDDRELFSRERGFLCRGIGGQTTSQMLVRFKADVLDLNPKAVHILAGTNDIAGNTGPTTLKRLKNNIKSMVEQAQARGIRVVLGSLLPANKYYWSPGIDPVPSIREMNRWLADYASAQKLTFIDYHSQMVDPTTNGLLHELSDDGVHPSRQGYSVMKSLVLKSL